jgi:mersacidin/lichenicidin family type 2 lantibiotic
MSNLDIIRAWKDPEFRSTLAFIPAHPAGEIDLAGAGLDGRAARSWTKDCGFPTHQCTHEQRECF